MGVDELGVAESLSFDLNGEGLVFLDGLGGVGGLEIPITDEPGIDDLIVGDRRERKDFNAEGNEVGAGEVFRLPDGDSKMAGGHTEVGEVKPRAVGAGLHDFVGDDFRVLRVGGPGFRRSSCRHKSSRKERVCVPLLYGTDATGHCWRVRKEALKR